MNLLTNVPNEVSARILFYSEGSRLGGIRSVSTTVRDIVDRNACFLFKACMFHEFPHHYDSHYKAWPYRTDWKNIYVLSTQCKIAEKEAIKVRAYIEARKRFNDIDAALMIVENVLNFLSITMNIAKVGTLGWSASREAIKAFMRANPHLSKAEAYKALGIIVREISEAII